MQINKETDITTLLSDNLISVRTYHACKLAGVLTLGQILSLSRRNMTNMKHCGEKTKAELLKLQMHYSDIGRAASKSSDDGNTDEVQVAHIKLKHIHPADLYALTAWLKERYHKLSIRSKNCTSGFDELETLFPFMYPTIYFDSGSVRNCGRKSEEEILTFLSDVKHHYECLTADIDYDRNPPDFDKAEILLTEIRHHYQFLTLDETQSVVDFTMETGQLPILFLAKRYIFSRHSTPARIHQKFYGLNASATRFSIDVIAASHYLTRERIRQITCTAFPMPLVLAEAIQSDIAPLLKDIISFDDPLWLRLQKMNMLQEPPANTALLVCAIAGSYSIVSLDAEFTPYLVRKPLLENVKLKTALRHLCSRIELKRSKQERLDVLSYLINDPKKEYHPKAPELCSLFIRYAKFKYGLNSEDSRYVIVPPSTVNISVAIEGILSEYGRPMHFKHLWQEFKSRYPESRISNTQSFRTYVWQNKNIKAKGKSGFYVLKAWKDQFIGSITDFLFLTLSKQAKAISIDKLLELTLLQFPHTNRNSIYALMYMDHKQRFVFYQDSYVGLASQATANDNHQKRLVRKYDFASRFATLEDFIKGQGRLPIQSGNYPEEERALARWVYNVLTRHISATDEEYSRLKDFLDSHTDLPQNGTEYRFKRLCDEFADIVRSTGKIPPIAQNHSAYQWFSQNRRRFRQFTDNRKKYFENLLEQIAPYIRNKHYATKLYLQDPQEATTDE